MSRISDNHDGKFVANELGRTCGNRENLYLATVGLIPNRSRHQPALTGAALAIRTADALAN